EALDRTCQDIRDSDHPFGGITVVFGGDFQQTLPVVKKGSQDDIIQSTIQQSYLWNSITILHLRRNMRLLWVLLYLTHQKLHLPTGFLLWVMAKSYPTIQARSPFLKVT
ncbi:PIF1-like helicase-domain-containing protein, partial [Lactarius quietus]